MEENYLLAILISFLFGFVFFRNDKQSEGDNTNNDESTDKRNNATGVDRYIASRQEDISENQPTGVSKYLSDKESNELKNEIDNNISSVAKYLASKKKERLITGVDKYLNKKS